MHFSFFGKKSFFIILGFVLIAIILVLTLYFYFDSKSSLTLSTPPTPSPNPTPVIKANTQVSGWVAWWAEDKAYDFIQRHPGKIYTVSPVWFMIGEEMRLEDAGKANRKNTVATLKENGIRVFPSLGSELTGDRLSPFIRNSSRVNQTIETLAEELVAMDADGIDIDLEGINKEDKSYFTLFLNKLQKRLKENDLKMSVTVHAQTKKVVWDGVEGQDLDWIGKNADEVRIMTYDEHSASTKPGPIASHKFIRDVIAYNLKYIDKEKIIIGIPSYGYVWADNNPKGLQFDEFNAYLKGKNYEEKRDKKSGEVIFKSDDFTGWLSDGAAMESKISFTQELGINKFIIWHLGGLDEKLFDKSQLQQPSL